MRPAPRRHDSESGKRIGFADVACAGAAVKADVPTGSLTPRAVYKETGE